MIWSEQHRAQPSGVPLAMLGRVARPPAALHRHLLPARIAAAVAHAGASQRSDGRPVPEPFYWEPGVLTDNTRSRNVPFADQPQFVIPGRMGDDAMLTETRGQESFRTALSAKRGGTLLHLRTLEWSVPWDVTISPDRTGTGGGCPCGVTVADPAVT